jgi:hypothetical protein
VPQSGRQSVGELGIGCRQRATNIRAKVRAANDRPRADAPITEASRDERCDPILRLLPVVQQIVLRVPQEGWYVELALTQVRLRVDGDVSLSAAHQVVMVKVAVHDPVDRLCELAQQLTC